MNSASRRVQRRQRAMTFLDAGKIQAFLDGIDVFAQQCFDTRAFAALNGVDDVVMLAVSVDQSAIHVIHIGLVESQSMWRRKRHMRDALQSLTYHRAACFLDDETVQAPVHFGVQGLVTDFDVAFLQDLIAVLEHWRSAMISAREAPASATRLAASPSRAPRMSSASRISAVLKPRTI